ncbi:RHS repeat-associated core domain-containing protein [Butyrivibrio sp. AE3003]|uniref:RHS repeat-associated core domain-containing protein n=1 Tax=Butyrivibrio sp. AE3003 TaxID=1496721 RepID=UPI001A9933D2|nr:RHS repeat-associated core domain-containing protein [Butyrivibrio sp. AE3003]
MTGTDGAVISSYAFDDFGRNIDPFTGNIRNNNSKHAYTKQGNIIQPFAFTGYQEDEVSGLKFAQARFYSTDNGRFVGEDQFPGLLTSASTLNKFLYCENSPIDFVDNNGKWLKLKDFDINDGLGVAAVTVGAVAATVGAIGVGIALTATAPISLPVLACCGAAKGNFLGGATGSTVADAITSIENGESISVKKVLGKATLSGIAQALISGPGDWISDVFNSANPSASEQLLWYAIHDTKNIGILSEAAGWIIDNIIDDKNNCEG